MSETSNQDNFTAFGMFVAGATQIGGACIVFRDDAGDIHVSMTKIPENVATLKTLAAEFTKDAPKYNEQDLVNRLMKPAPAEETPNERKAKVIAKWWAEVSGAGDIFETVLRQRVSREMPPDGYLRMTSAADSQTPMLRLSLESAGLSQDFLPSGLDVDAGASGVWARRGPNSWEHLCGYDGYAPSSVTP